MSAFFFIAIYVAGVLTHARYWGNRVVRNEGPRGVNWMDLVEKFPERGSVPEWLEKDRSEQRTLAALYTYCWPVADACIGIWWVARKLARLPELMAKLPEAMATTEEKPITENTFDYRTIAPQGRPMMVKRSTHGTGPS